MVRVNKMIVIEVDDSVVELESSTSGSVGVLFGSVVSDGSVVTEGSVVAVSVIAVGVVTSRLLSLGSKSHPNMDLYTN